MAITAQMVKELREITGAGPLDSKKALEQFDGDIEKAVTFLREKGLAKAAKKLGAGRAMNEGVVESYMHFNKRLGVMVFVVSRFSHRVFFVLIQLISPLYNTISILGPHLWVIQNNHGYN